MLSTAEQVAQALARDAIAREGLRRGIINLRALARWMIATHGLASSEEAVLSALRRNPSATAPPDPAVRQILEESHVDTASNMCSVMLKHGLDSPVVRTALAEFLDARGGEFVRIAASNTYARLVVRGDRLPAVRQSFGALIDEVRENLTEISVTQTKASLNIPGVVAFIVGALSFRGVNFFGIVRHQSALQLLVKQEDAVEALAAVGGVVGKGAHAASR